MFIRLGDLGTASEKAEISDFRHRRQQDIIVAMAVEELGIKLRQFQVDVILKLVFLCSGHGSMYKDGLKVRWKEYPRG